MLRLREWNEILAYADNACKELKEIGYNVKSQQYEMYDGRKGIYLIVYDNQSKEYSKYASGIHDTVKAFKSYIDMNKRRIVAEC